jgi:integrase
LGAGLRIHDLRRRFGFDVARSAGLHMASKLLRHSSVVITETHYAPLGIGLLRDAVEKLAEVVPFRNAS